MWEFSIDSTGPWYGRIAESLSENRKGRSSLEGVCVGGRIILREILKECNVGVWLGFYWLCIWANGWLLWIWYVTLDEIFVEQLRECQFLKMGQGPYNILSWWIQPTPSNNYYLRPIFRLVSFFRKKMEEFRRSSYCLSVFPSESVYLSVSTPNFLGLWDHFAVCEFIRLLISFFVFCPIRVLWKGDSFFPELFDLLCYHLYLCFGTPGSEVSTPGYDAV
jgi:hypothetical protein